MKVKFFAQRYISFIQRFKLDSWFLLLLSMFICFQEIHSCQQAQLLTKKLEKVQQRFDNNIKKFNLLKSQAELVESKADRVKNERQSCLKNNRLPNECERIMSHLVLLSNQLKAIQEQIIKLNDEIQKDYCLLYSESDNKSCPKSAKFN
ncbi:hypothetical protein FD724_33750 (plasmid) [Nostoc sp. C057]|uniref:hypothetical protein n=1 Tax=Nostoc sp. C057 TaxID=2576903 RepID=UPI0015C39AD8|nr:hypothetical protein [Nostoc sp. C057]QLE52930.1 hypothetical protein FD724_33750 [Nostoc sp. C057]